MKWYKVNNVEVESDGDWNKCPECDNIDFPLLSWMSYCPCCGIAVSFERNDDNYVIQEVEGEQ